jgi:hypothetical protein
MRVSARVSGRGISPTVREGSKGATFINTALQRSDVPVRETGNRFKRFPERRDPRYPPG